MSKGLYKMKAAMRFSLFAVLLCMMVSCEDFLNVSNEYSTHQCYYIIDFSFGHTASPLYAALGGTNTFCMISEESTGGSAYKLRAWMHGTAAHEETISEEYLTRPTRQLGLNDGLIIGKSSFQNGDLYVFDRQCPNCYNEYHRMNYALNFTDALNVKCPNCQRVYSLLSSGAIASGGSGEKLFRYHATYTGQRLTIANPK
ncbi:MAG: hypothetical protein IKQ68_06540 [Prevotella sp.]|nr:hypothetical protein [Prevotella sp.]